MRSFVVPCPSQEGDSSLPPSPMGRWVLALFFLSLIVALLAACSQGPDNSGYRPPKTAGPPTPTAAAVLNSIPPVSGQTITMPDGLQFVVVQDGNGPEPEAGQTVRVNYTGWLTANGSKFDSSFDRNEPISFALGTGQVIKGWDEGIAMMRVGEKRRLIIPPDLAYGAQGRPPQIPPSSSLTFDVELVGIQG